MTEAMHLSKIVHDMKSPLNIILSSASMLRMKSDSQTLGPEDLQQYLHYIEQNCHRLLRFTNDLLRSPADQAKPPALLTSQCDIVSFLKCIVNDLSLLAEQRSIQLQLDNQIAEPFL